MSDIKKREKVQSACSNPDARADSSKRARAVTHADTDKALIIWFRRKAVLPDIRIDGSMFLIQANKFRVQLDLTDSNILTLSWIDCFNKRHGIVRVKKAGESGGVDIEIVHQWKEGRLCEK